MKKPTMRIIAWILVIMLTLGLFSGALLMFANASLATPSETTIPADTTVSKTLTVGRVSENITIKFRFVSSDSFPPLYDFDEFSIASGTAFVWSTKSTLEIEDKGNYYEATLKAVTYTGTGNVLELTTDGGYYFYVPIPGKYFRESSASDPEDVVPVSDIMVQSTIVRNAEGKKLGVVNKDSGRFTVEIIYYDLGLKDESSSAIDAAKKYAFITTPAGFKLYKGSMGTVERMSSSAGYPRFKATFEGVASTGTANTISFRVQYDFTGYSQGIKGEAVATLFQIDSESSSEAESESPPLKPKIIIQEYSYGDNAIVAGNEFSLDMVLVNTSTEVAAENVEMKIKPANGFYIASGSNTVYFPRIGVGESKPYSVSLKAMPSQNTGVAGQNATDYKITIEFLYQYPTNSKGDYGDNSTSEDIAIPVEQLDRFSVDEITDYTSYLTVGSEGYVTVPITNKGKSATMNISASIRSGSGADFVAPPVYFGSLAANESGTVSINITINTPGEFSAEAVISYEDENMNQKEITAPFIIMVDEPWTPPPEMPLDPEMEQPQNAISPFSIILCSLGGLMLASPAAMILTKRIKSRGNEDIDEDF